MGQYISQYSGEQIDAAVASYIFNQNQQRVIFSHTITTDMWQGSAAPYSITVTLTGVYSVGEYPIVYFIDSNGVRYEVDYTTTINSGAGTSTAVIYSNIQIAGTIIEVASVSTSQPSNN